MSRAFKLAGKSNAITFAVANTREQKDDVWVNLDNAVSRVPRSDYIFVLKDANAETGVRKGDDDCNVNGAYGRDIRVVSALCGLGVTTRYH